MEPMAADPNKDVEGNYTLVLEGYDWGPAVKKVILTMSDTISELKATDFTVAVERSAEGVAINGLNTI